MGFQEQIYSLAYLTERKPLWFLPWNTALQTKPATNSNTDGEIQKSSKHARSSGVVKDEMPQHSSTLQQRVDQGREGGRLPTMHLLTPPQLPAPRAAEGGEAGERAGSCAHAPTWHRHTWAPPEERCQGPSATAARQERDQNLGGQRAQADTCYSRAWQRTRAPCHARREPPCITEGKEMLGRLFDWNITVNRREN